MVTKVLVNSNAIIKIIDFIYLPILKSNSLHK